MDLRPPLASPVAASRPGTSRAGATQPGWVQQTVRAPDAVARTAAPPPLLLDRSQRAALDGARESRAALILGAPGTGKTTLVQEIVADAVERDGLSPDDVLVLSATRRGAGVLRDTLATRLGRTVRGAVVRTAASAGFAVLAAQAQDDGDPAPTLITGPEQDLALAELLAGHAAGEGADVGWPTTFPEETLALRGFRAELRDLLMRVAERGLGPQDLTVLGRRHGRPEWEAAGRLYDEYLSVMALRQLTPDAGRRYDPAGVVDQAAYVLDSWEGDGRPRWRLVVVDDYQEATAATARLCHVMADDGARLVLLGDPDVSAQAFRGATPALVGRAAAGSAPVRPSDGEQGPVGGATGRRTPSTARGPEQIGEFGAEVFVLDTVWRHGSRLREVTRAVTQEIGSVGAVEHRRASGVDEQAGGAEGAAVAAPSRAAQVVETAVLPSVALEEAHIAKTLRGEHLLEGTRWSQMAVVARSGADLLRLRRALGAAGVPVAVVGADVPLRDEPAVRPLLAALRTAATGQIEVEDVVGLLTSPLGGIDAVGLRRLRRALRGEELSAGGTRSSDELLVEMIADPARAASLPSDVSRAPRRVAAMLAAAREAIDEPRATAQTVLWSLWSAAGVAETWRSIAVNGGPGSARADRDLDAAMALFRAAEQFVDRVPQATALAFADHLQSQDLPADNLAARALAEDTVQLLTPAGAAGNEWEVVVVAGVQDGSWPDLRLRDSLLGSQALVEVLSGRSQDARGIGREARRAVLADELRAFAVAVSRARRRLVVTATRDTENEPSVFVDLVEPPDEDAGSSGPAGGGEPGLGAVPDVFAAPLDLRGVVATLRTELVHAVTDEDRAQETAVAQLLAHLAVSGVPEADPTSWYGSAELSSDAALRGPQEQVVVSPSKVEQVSRCSLRWALESAGATGAQALSQSVGNLLHDIARELPVAGHGELAARLDARWHELGLPDGWPAVQMRRSADAMVERLAAYYKEVAGVPVVEESFQVEVGRAVLRGSADRLEPSGDGGVRVTDLKTGKGVPTKAEALTNAQLGAYQLAVEAGAFPSLPPGTHSSGAQLVFLSGGTRGTVRHQEPIGPEENSWARALVEESAETMAGSRFAAQENSLCAMCSVRRSCPLQSEGRQVVDLGTTIHRRPLGEPNPAASAPAPMAAPQDGGLL